MPNAGCLPRPTHCTTQDLSRRHEALELKCGGMRNKMRDACGALGERERQLETAQKLVQRLGQERSEAQASQANDRLAMRCLESKVSELKEHSELAARHAKAKQQVREAMRGARGRRLHAIRARAALAAGLCQAARLPSMPCASSQKLDVHLCCIAQRG